MEQLEYLRHEVIALKKLLDDPQPGTISWCLHYGEKMQNIIEFWGSAKVVIREKPLTLAKN